MNTTYSKGVTLHEIDTRSALCWFRTSRTHTPFNLNAANPHRTEAIPAARQIGMIEVGQWRVVPRLLPSGGIVKCGLSP